VDKKANWFAKASDKIKSSVFENRAWKFIKRPGVMTVQWENSNTANALDTVLNFPGKIIRNIFDKTPEIFESSLFFKLIKFASDNLYILMALFLAIAAVIPHLQWSNGFTVIASIALLFLHIIKSAIFKDEGFNIRAIDPTFLIYGLITLLAAVASTFAAASTLEFIKYHLPCYIFVVLIVSNINSKEKLGTFLTIFLVGVSISGIYGIIQYINGIPVDPSQVDLSVFENPVGRVYSTMHNANSYAEALMLTLPFFAGMFFCSKNLKGKIFYAIMAVPPFIAFMLTQSRTGYVSLAVAVVVFLFFKNRKLILIVIPAGLAVIPFLPRFLYERVLSIFRKGWDTTVGARKIVFETALKIIRDFWLSGVGVGVTPFIHYSYKYKIGLLLPHSHNVYLEVWLETGIIGLISFLWLNIRLFKNSVLNIAKNTDIYISNLLIAAISALTGILVFSLAEYVWFYPRVLLYYWVLVGIILSGLDINKKKVSTDVQFNEEVQKD